MISCCRFPSLLFHYIYAQVYMVLSLDVLPQVLCRFSFHPFLELILLDGGRHDATFFSGVRDGYSLILCSNILGVAVIEKHCWVFFLGMVWIVQHYLARNS